MQSEGLLQSLLESGMGPPFIAHLPPSFHSHLACRSEEETIDGNKTPESPLRGTVISFISFQGSFWGTVWNVQSAEEWDSSGQAPGLRLLRSVPRSSPLSRTTTCNFKSSERRLARKRPAAPPPMMKMSKACQDISPDGLLGAESRVLKQKTFMREDNCLETHVVANAMEMTAQGQGVEFSRSDYGMSPTGQLALPMQWNH